MEFKIFKNKQELLADGHLPFYKSDIDEYDRLTTESYAVKITDGADALFVLRVRGDMRLFGVERLAHFAAQVVGDCHFKVDVAVGEQNLISAFFDAYVKRFGGTVEYEKTQSGFKATYRAGSIKQALFAGGCFWCMAKPYYEYDGIVKVLSGYAGGDGVCPTYEEVKTGLTGHKETVLLEYDSAVISYRELVDIYFDTIDPFDEDGQFIDRGDNYTCAIFTNDENEIQTAKEYIAGIERQSGRKVYVEISADTVFYKAEEYHQDYALKNPEAMADELKKSGRQKE